jgi:hypothetical protein
VWEEVGRLAADEAIEIRESELIGLAPQAALLDVAAHAGADDTVPVERRIEAAADALRIRDFRLDIALELRLAAATGTTT